MKQLKAFLTAAENSLTAGGLEFFDVPRPYESDPPIMCAALDYSVADDAPGARDYYVALCAARDSIMEYCTGNGYKTRVFSAGHVCFIDIWKDAEREPGAAVLPFDHLIMEL